MNIFEILSNGKGCVNEENVSSFLSYLLQPTENHDLKDVFLKRFLELIHVPSFEIESYNIDVELEYAVYPTNKKCRRIDLLFETKEHVIAIENKTLESSIEPNQLQEEYNGLKNDIRINKPIVLCFLTPDTNKQENVVVDNLDKFVHIKWEDITTILKDILQKEFLAEINPINDYVKQTIRAFINFMKDEPLSKTFKLNECLYMIYQYPSKQIIVKEISNNYQNVVKARNIIREKLFDINPEQYSWEATDMGNTRNLGAKLIKELKNES